MRVTLIWIERWLEELVALTKAGLMWFGVIFPSPVRHLSLGVLGHGLGSLRHSVLGELTGEDEAHRGLDIAGAEGLTLAAADQAASFLGDLLEGVHAEGVEHGHTFLGDAHGRVHLLAHLVDVHLVRLLGAALTDFRHGE